MDFEKICPLDLVRHPNIKKWMIENKIIKIDEYDGQIRVVIPSFECTIGKNDKIIKTYFTFYYQVFWHLLEETKDLKYAKSEFELIMGGNKSYTFSNGNYVELKDN